MLTGDIVLSKYISGWKQEERRPIKAKEHQHKNK